MLNAKSPKYWAFKNPGYSWLSLSQIFDISNFALSGIIYPVQYLAFDQSKNLSVSGISISRIFAYVKQIVRFLEQFFLVISNFSQNFQNVLQFFFSNSFFSTPAGTITATVPAKISEDSHVEFFLSFFWSNVLIRLFWSLEYSIKEIVHFLLIFFPSKQSLEHVKLRVSGVKFRIKKNKPNPNLNVLLSL